MNTMTETVATDCPPVARATVSRRRSARPATVSASALAQHFDCSRTYVAKLEADGVIQRQGDGFPLDQSRVAGPNVGDWLVVVQYDQTAHEKLQAAIAQDPECQQAFAEIGKFATRISQEMVIDLDL
jgi:hypothetical protein